MEKYAPEQIREALARMTARDNTRTANAPAGYVPAEERPLRDRSDVGIDEGVMGLVPGVGDVLQGGQALISAGEGKYRRAALGAGLLFVPNIVDKPVKMVRQAMKSGLPRVLRHQPLGTIDLDRALAAPYRGQNFIHHDLPGEYVRDVLNGETRVMSPSLAVNRWGDYNDLYTPGFYGDHVFIGDRSMLDNSRLFRGDGMTPTVGEVWYGSPVPSDMREKVAEDVWRKMEREGNIGANTIDDWRELERLDLPSGDLYFEAKYHGAYPLEDFRHGIFPEPKSKVEEDIINAYDRRGLPIDTYKAVGGNEGYNNKVETLLKVLNENPDYLFAKGGKVMTSKRSSGKTPVYDVPDIPLRGLLYNPAEQVVPDTPMPLRYYPQPNLGDYEYLVSTGMAENYPIPVTYDVSAPGSGVLIPGEGPVVSQLLDPKADAARRIMAVENSKGNPNGGWDAKTGRWYPHRSHEGGADTIAYGIKLSNGTPEAKLALKQGYLTDEQATHFVDTLVNRYYDAAKKVYDKKYGDGEWDKLSDKSQSILVDYSYNPGLAKFPKLMEGFHSGDMDLIRQNYKRYVNGKELGRNKTLLEEIDTLGNEYPIFRKYGGKLYGDGGKYPTSTTGAFLRGAADYLLRRKTPRSFIESEYRPTVGDNGEVFYTRPGLKNEVALNLFGGTDYGKRTSGLGDEYFYKDFNDAYDKISGHPSNRDRRASSNGTLGRYSVTAGKDDRGRYLSFSDTFDFVTLPGKPINIYDRIYEDEVSSLYDPNSGAVMLGDWISRSPILGDLKASGGKIHIAPSKRGTFTAAAKKHGKSVQAFASQVLAHKENYSPAMVKKANFARNAAKWHSEGGILDKYPPDKIRQALEIMKAGS